MEHMRIAPLRNFRESDDTRRCSKCGDWLDLSSFSTRVSLSNNKDLNKRIPTLYYREICKNCSLGQINVDKYCGKEVRREKHRIDPRKVMLVNARKRAKDNNLPFDISYEDITIPTICPLLGISISVGNNVVSANSPTIDRLVPELGYTKGNVLVICHKANTCKGDLSLESLELLVKNLRRVLYKEEELLES